MGTKKAGMISCTEKTGEKKDYGKKEGGKGGEAPTYYCSVSQKMWCKVETAKKDGAKFELHYDCAGKKRKVSIGGEDERVSSGKEKPTKACGGAKKDGEKKESKKKEGEKKKDTKEGKKKEGEKKEGEKKEGEK